MEKEIKFKCSNKEIVSKFVDMSDVCDRFSDFCEDMEFFIRSYEELEENDIKIMKDYITKINEICGSILENVEN